MPNAWDVGSAVLFASLGFDALATTSGGFAASKGRLDGAMSKDDVLAHCAELVAAVDVPVSADLENCFADEPEGVAATIDAAIELGLAGGSVEDFTGDRDNPIYELAQAADRVRAAAEVAHRGPVPFVLTARAENYLHHRMDLADTIARLQAYQEAGADVLFAPRVVQPSELAQLLASVDRPVSVLVTPNTPSLDELAALGVSRISVGGAVAAASYGYAIRAVTQLRDEGAASYWDLAGAARTDMLAAFGTPP
jgi:2-methylisocitrate lyase-like PEP mutase family enzyme